MPLWALAVLFLLIPIAELYVIDQVVGAIGWQWTLVLLVADSVLGAWLLRHQGRSVWRRFNDINVVDIDYKPFDASAWPIADSGLLGPVTLAPLRGEAEAARPRARGPR